MKTTFSITFFLLLSTYSIQAQQSLSSAVYERLQTLSFNDFIRVNDSIFMEQRDSSGNLSKNEKYYRRWLSFMESRLSYSGAVSDGSGGSFSHTQDISGAVYSCTEGVATSPWEVVGPKPTPTDLQAAGLITDVTTPTLSDWQTMYAGTEISGLWKTTDGGMNWQNITDILKLPTLGVNSILVDPGNANHLVVALNYREYGALDFNGMRIIKSYDGGATWTKASINNLTNGAEYIECIKYDPHDNTNSRILGVGGKKIYESTDGGDNWNCIHTLSTTQQINLHDIEFSINNPSVIMISSIWNDYLSPQAGPRLYVSTDNGTTWNDKTPPNQTLTNNGVVVTSGQVISIDVTPANPNTFYTLYANGTGLTSTLYIASTQNNGDTWQILDTEIIDNRNSGNSWHYGMWKHEFEVSNHNPNIFYGGGNRVFRKNISNAGSSWAGISEYTPRAPGYESTHADIRCFKQLELGNGNDVLLMSNDGGISITEDAQAVTYNSSTRKAMGWQNLNGYGLIISELKGLSCSEYNQHIYTGATHNGIKRYLPQTDLWEFILGGNGAIEFTDGEWTATSNTQDLGYYSAWSHIKYYEDGTPHLTDNFFLDGNVVGRKFTIDPIDQTNFWWGSKSVYRYDKSTDVYDSLYGIPDVWTDNTGDTHGTHEISRIAVAASDPNIMYFAQKGATWTSGKEIKYKFMKSTDGGQSWNIDLSENFPNNLYEHTYINDIIVHPDNPNKIWVACAMGLSEWSPLGTDPEKGKERVLYSNDGGNSWVDISNGNPLVAPLDPNNSNRLPMYPVNTLQYYEGSDDLIFAGTDAGVFYYDKSINGWKCFNNNFPIAVVNILDINYCENKLYAGTYGRGAWAAPIHFSEGHKTITSNQTWSLDKFIGHDITIPHGVTLTINGGATIYMAKNKKIIVETGGRLVVNNAQITSNCGPWGGIEVNGDRNLFQNTNHQGLVQLSGATIENALTAISTKRSTASGWDYNTTGGMIFATASSFINNKRDVELLSYHRKNPNNPSQEMNNACYFHRCTFSTNDNYEPATTWGNITLWDVNGVQIKGCVFEDNRSNLNIAQQGRMGIHSINAAFTVGSYCQYNTCPTPINSQFNGLKYGIKSFGQNSPLFRIEVSETDFNSRYGMYLNGMQWVRVIKNNFVTNSNASATKPPYSLYLDYCQEYTIQENNFVSDATTTGNPTVGVIVKNQHGGNTEIYKNNFNGFTVANEAIGQNKGAFNIHGLEFICNTYTNGTFDFYIKDHPAVSLNGITVNHGESNATSPNEASGNLFGNSSAALVKNIANDADFFNYYHHDPTGVPNVVPAIVDPNVNLVMENVIWSSSTCPSRLVEVPITERINKKSSSKTQFDLKRNLLAAQVDGGNTPQLEMEVITATNQDAYNHYTHLMSNKGYVSEGVLEELSQKENGFTNAMIRNVLVANPHAPKSKNIQEKLDNRSQPLPPYMRYQINQGLTHQSAKEVLEKQATRHKKVHDQAIHDGVDQLLKQEMVNTQQFIQLVANTHDVEHQLIMADVYDARGDFTQAQNALNEAHQFAHTPQQETQIELKEDFRTLMLNWQQQHQNHSALSAANLAELTVFTQYQNITTGKAMALLELNQQLQYSEPVYLPDAHTKQAPALWSLQPTAASTNVVQAYPNPATDFVTLNYTLVGPASSITLTLFDKAGKVHYSRNLEFLEDEIIVPLKLLAAGNYFISLKANNQIVKTIPITKHAP